MPLASGFVQRLGAQLLLGGAPFRIVGGNTYYLGYVLENTLNQALDLAASLSLNVLRTWAFLDTPKAPGPYDVSYQYWDPAQNGIQINAAGNGLERLDRAIANAAERGIRMILTLTNNWTDFGGMPQYVQWCGIDPKQKNLFYTDPRCREAYKNWARNVITRRNTITGRLYSDEPAILAWELANEPRCEGSGGVDTLLTWVDEMSTFVRTLDANHLIAVGDEGYFKHEFAFGNALYNGAYGVSCEQLLGVGAIDFGTVHMYPQSMAAGQDPVEFGLMWIREHIAAGQRANKPMLIEEYGMMVGGPKELQTAAERNEIFDVWLKSIEDQAGVGDLLWMLGLPKSDGQPYAPDHYVVSAAPDVPSVSGHAAKMFPPVH